MSRSTRRPYTAPTGVRSARIDKQIASRGVRRRQNRWLTKNWDNEDAGPTPNPLECHHNDVWAWGRDGHQCFHAPTNKDWSEYRRVQRELTLGLLAVDHWEAKEYGSWPPRWYAKLLRK